MKKNPPQGFTLVEVMVAFAVSLIVIAGVFAMYIAQQQAFRSGTKARERQNFLRTGLDFVERDLRRAGFGVDPQLAFDFDFYDCTKPDGSAIAYASPACAALTRDAADAPDEIVFYARNPSYQMSDSGPAGGNAWQVEAGSDDSALNLTMRAGESIPANQVLLVVCSGAMGYTYVTTSTTVKTNTAAAVSVPLAAQVDDNPYRQNFLLAPGTTSTAGCFTLGGAVAYRVDRFHYFLMSDVGNGGQATEPRSYLVLDTGTDRNLDDNIDVKDLVPIAGDIVDLQFAYVMLHNHISGPQSAYIQDSDGNGVWGDDSTVAEELTSLVGDPTLSAQISTLSSGNCPSVSEDFFPAADVRTWGRYQDPCMMGNAPETPERQMDYPGNIASVRVSMVGRTRRESQNAITEPFPPANGLENRPLFDPLATPGNYASFFSTDAARRNGYGYMVLQTSVSTPAVFTISKMFMF